MNVIGILSDWEPVVKEKGVWSFAGNDGEYERRRVTRTKYDVKHCAECDSEQPVCSDPFHEEGDDTCMGCLYQKAVDLASQTMGEIEAHKKGDWVEDWEVRTIKESTATKLLREQMTRWMEETSKAYSFWSGQTWMAKEGEAVIEKLD